MWTATTAEHTTAAHYDIRRSDRRRDGRMWSRFEPTARRGGTAPCVDVRELIDGIMYVLSTVCPVAAIPKDLPFPITLVDFLICGLRRHARSHPSRPLCVCRESRRTESSPTPPSSDSQSVKSQKKGGCIDPAMAMSAKRSSARSAIIPRRYAGLLLCHAIVHRRLPDRDGRHSASCDTVLMYPFLEICCRRGYQGPEVQKALARILP